MIRISLWDLISDLSHFGKLRVFEDSNLLPHGDPLVL